MRPMQFSRFAMIIASVKHDRNKCICDTGSWLDGRKINRNFLPVTFVYTYPHYDNGSYDDDTC